MAHKLLDSQSKSRDKSEVGGIIRLELVVVPKSRKAENLEGRPRFTRS